MNDIKIGDVCAVRSSDSNWYRSKIESINGDKIKVIHCEYGNVETVHKSKLRVLDEKFAKVNDLVVNAYFAIKSNNEKTLLNEMRKIFDDGAKEFSFKIIERFHDGFILEPIEISDGKNIIDDLVKSGKAERINVSDLSKKVKPRKSVEPEKKQNDRKSDKKSPEKSEKPEKQKKLPLPVEKTDTKKVEKIPIKVEIADEMKVKLTALSSSTDFYVMEIQDVTNFQKLQADIQIISSSASKLTSFDENALCLAKQPFDLHWYRSKIIDSDENMITVRCVDDGKTFSVEDRNLLLTMPTAFKERKFFSISCSLPVKVDKKSDEIVTDLLLQKVDKEFTITYFWKNSEINFVDLLNEDESIVDTLISKNLAEKFEFLDDEKAFTSHINSTSSFFLQLESDQLKLDVISKFFEDAKGKFEHFEVKVGDIVAALYPEDECWYRSRIDKIMNSDKKYLVTFIDFGNSCEVEKIGKIEESTIENLPKMSKHCSLSIPTRDSIEISESKFKEICDNGATILNVKMIKPGIPAEVEIHVDGKNILELLTKK